MVRLPAFALIMASLVALPTSAAACSLCSMPSQGAPMMAELAAGPANESGPRVEILDDLNFAKIALTGQQGAIVVIDAASGQAQGSGGAVILGGMDMSGRARIIGAPGRLVNVDLPQQITMQSRTGERATLRAIRSNLPPNPRLGSDGTLTFSFGGTLMLPSTVTGGDFSARLTISTSYQ